jgi:polyisoprenoid-binding protein YceI
MQSVQVAAQTAAKKPYVRPELTKHGKVESLTQTAQLQGGGSHPFTGGGSGPAIAR